MVASVTNIEYPQTYTCACGLKAPLTHQNIKTRYRGMNILVEEVPVYICANEHLKLARTFHMKLEQCLQRAYVDGVDVIEFS